MQKKVRLAIIVGDMLLFTLKITVAGMSILRGSAERFRILNQQVRVGRTLLKMYVGSAGPVIELKSMGRDGHIKERR